VKLDLRDANRIIFKVAWYGGWWRIPAVENGGFYIQLYIQLFTIWLFNIAMENPL
jgi:hypothetical protein